MCHAGPVSFSSFRVGRREGILRGRNVGGGPFYVLHFGGEVKSRN